MIETPEEEAEQEERIEQGKRLVEAFLRRKGREPGVWAGPQGDRYLLRVGERQLEVPDEALGDSGGGGQLTAELRAFLDAALRKL